MQFTQHLQNYRYHGFLEWCMQTDWRRAVSSVAGLAILFASDGLMASYAHLQRCSLAELKLGGLAVVWDNVSAAGLSPVAIVDFAGKWDARDAERLRTQDIERCRFVPARLREDCRQASRASQAVNADLEAAADQVADDERPGAAAAASAAVAAHSQAQLKRIVRRGEPSVFSSWGRRLQWLKFYVLVQAHAALPGVPLLLADADVVWLRRDAPEHLAARCRAGIDLAFMRDGGDASYVGNANAGFILSCGTPAAVDFWRRIELAILGGAILGDAVLGSAVLGSRRGAIGHASRGAPSGAQHDASRGAPNGAQHDASRGAPNGAQHDASRGAPSGAQHDANSGAPSGAQHDASRGAPKGAQHDANGDARTAGHWDGVGGDDRLDEWATRTALFNSRMMALYQKDDPRHFPSSVNALPLNDQQVSATECH